MVKGANAAILLSCIGSLALSCVIAYVGCRSLSCCTCYDNRTGLVRDYILSSITIPSLYEDGFSKLWMVHLRNVTNILY